VDLAAVFASAPKATPLDSLPDAWRWGLAPKLDFAAALSTDRKHAFQLFALRTYDEGLVVAVLSFAREHESELVAPPEQPLTLAEGFSHPSHQFDVVVTIGPSVHKYQEGEAHERTRAVFPAYRCEFAGDEDEEDAHYRYTRAAGVPATNLNREPRPYVKMRFVTDSGEEIPERGFVPVPSLVIQMREIRDSDRFVEFENYRHEVYHVEWDGQYVVSGASSGRFDHESLLEFVKGVIYGPNVDAGTSEFRDHH
jgi:hypothetical protein